MLRRLCDDGGKLVRVCGLFSCDAAQRTIPLLEGVVLYFERGMLAIEATAGDEIVVAERFDSDGGYLVEDIGQEAPWRVALGLPVLWIWCLTNQQEYDDAIQVEFREKVDGRSVTVQLLAVASHLRVSVVKAEESV